MYANNYVILKNKWFHVKIINKYLQDIENVRYVYRKL